MRPDHSELETSAELTALLAAARDGDRGAVDRIMPLVYQRLRILARRQLRRLRPGQTLQTTGLVHEAYLRLVDQQNANWQDRNHFFCVAAVAMRQILVDYARQKHAKKRGGDALQVTLEDIGSGEPDQRSGAVELLDLDQALETLAAADTRLCQLVELRFFAGLTVEETAEALGLSSRTVKRDWRKARAFLHREMTSGAPATERGS